MTYMDQRQIKFKKNSDDIFKKKSDEIINYIHDGLEIKMTKNKTLFFN